MPVHGLPSPCLQTALFQEKKLPTFQSKPYLLTLTDALSLAHAPRQLPRMAAVCSGSAASPRRTASLSPTQARPSSQEVRAAAGELAGGLQDQSGFSITGRLRATPQPTPGLRR